MSRRCFDNAAFVPVACALDCSCLGRDRVGGPDVVGARVGRGGAVSYDRTLYAPGSPCAGNPGTEVIFDESIDYDASRLLAEE